MNFERPRRGLTTCHTLGGFAAALLCIAATIGHERAARAQCSGDPESGVWYNHQGDDPYKIEVFQPACNDTGGPSSSVWHVRVWSRQSNGALYQRGTFDAGLEHRADRTTWIVPKPYLVGAYLQHLWLKRSASRDSMLVWIRDESLDSKPSAEKNNAFARTPAPAPAPTPAPIKSIGRVRVAPSGEGPVLSLCERARDARARNSPAAANLEAQCRAHPEVNGAAVPTPAVPVTPPPPGSPRPRPGCAHGDAHCLAAVAMICGPKPDPDCLDSVLDWTTAGFKRTGGVYSGAKMTGAMCVSAIKNCVRQYCGTLASPKRGDCSDGCLDICAAP